MRKLIQDSVNKELKNRDINNAGQHIFMETNPISFFDEKNKFG